MSACVRCGHDPGFPVAVCSSCGFGQSSAGLEPTQLSFHQDDATLIERGSSRAPTARAFLFVRGGPDTGMQVPVSGTVTIGRDADNSMCLQDRRVSGRHALVRGQGNGFVYQDLLGANGTFYIGASGEVRITAPHRLSDGDRLRMGHTVIQFVSIDGER